MESLFLTTSIKKGQSFYSQLIVGLFLILLYMKQLSKKCCRLEVMTKKIKREKMSTSGVREEIIAENLIPLNP